VLVLLHLDELPTAARFHELCGTAPAPALGVAKNMVLLAHAPINLSTRSDLQIQHFGLGNGCGYKNQWAAYCTKSLSCLM
jgi:hypothetical protein